MWEYIYAFPLTKLKFHSSCLNSFSISEEISWNGLGAVFTRSCMSTVLQKEICDQLHNCRIIVSSWGVGGGKWVYLSQLFHETPVLFKLIMAHRYAFLQKALLTLWYYKKSVDHQILQDSFSGFWWIRVSCSNFLNHYDKWKKKLNRKSVWLWFPVELLQYFLWEISKCN